jgi:hypothetical protein
MADFNIRTDAVDVEQIMRQIRARIQEKRGVDYTEQQIQELANVKLERFLDPKGVRSDLVEQFKRARDRKLEPFEPEQYGFDANMLYGSHRGIIRFFRKILNPLLKLFFNPNPLIQVLHKQTEINALYEKQFYLLREKSQQRDDVDVLYYELVHNLVLELTRIGIEHRNVKMRLESLSSRMDFDERRARALEGVVQYRPATGPARDVVQRHQPRPASQAPVFQPAPSPGPNRTPHDAGDSAAAPATPPTEDATAESTTAHRRRRRRRGRRGGRGRTPGDNMVPVTAAGGAVTSDTVTPPHGDPTGDAAFDAHASTSESTPDMDSGDDEGPEPSGQ